MVTTVFPDTTVLCNFAAVQRMDLLEGWLRGRGRWTAAVRYEVGRSRAYLPGLASVIARGWLGETVEMDGHEEAIEGVRQGVFGGLPEEPLKHLGEAQTCFLIRNVPEYADAWWVTEDGDAYAYGKRTGMQTLHTLGVMQAIVADGDLTAQAALGLMRAMEAADRNLLCMPKDASELY